MVEVFLVRKLESELPYVFLYYVIPIYYYLAALICAIYAKHVTITPKDIELVDSQRVMNSGKS
jgi:hypothetical protein